jgi:hypothetical protein
MRVVAEARDHMPVQVRHDIAERGEVDLVGRHHFTQRGFAGEHHLHQCLPLGDRQVGHFPDVGIEDDAQKTRVVRLVGAHHAALGVAPQHAAAIGLAKGARGHGHSCEWGVMPRHCNGALRMANRPRSSRCPESRIDVRVARSAR